MMKKVKLHGVDEKKFIKQELEDYVRDLQDYDFTQDWFTRHETYWKAFLGELKPTKILEIGSFEGKATSWMIEYCSQFGDLDMYCVDKWDNDLEYSDVQQTDLAGARKRFDENIVVAKGKVESNVEMHIYAATSVVGLSEIAAAGIHDFDLVYVDASHLASNVFFDASMAFQLCKIGGGIIFDDYTEDEISIYNYPKVAIDAWRVVHENKIKLVDFFADGKPLSQDEMWQRYFWKGVE